MMALGDGDPPSLETLLNRTAWVKRAACRGVGAETFLIARGRKYSRRELCDAVRQECLETALNNPELQGFWEGTSEADRRADAAAASGGLEKTLEDAQ